MEPDVEYFSRRAEEERFASTRAVQPAVRQAHIEMAQGFEELAKAIRANNIHLGLSTLR